VGHFVIPVLASWPQIRFGFPFPGKNEHGAERDRGTSQSDHSQVNNLPVMEIVCVRQLGTLAFLR
jgi:hypothetical protein